ALRTGHVVLDTAGNSAGWARSASIRLAGHTMLDMGWARSASIRLAGHTMLDMGWARYAGYGLGTLYWIGLGTKNSVN
ncbi:924_t:CDS:1, partial [Ambispora leptoticha]